VPVTPEIDPPAMHFAFDISVGVRTSEKDLRDEIDRILTRNRNEVTKILDQYGVPRVGNAEEKSPGIAVPGLGAAHTRVE